MHSDIGIEKRLEILGDGQIWDLKGITPQACPDKTFEDLFSGRALAGIARRIDRNPSSGRHFFSLFREKGKVTGISVTRALLSADPQAKKMAKAALEELAKNGADGIAALTRGKGFKKGWPVKQKNYWKGLNIVIIGGGVSEDRTGQLLTGYIKKHLAKHGLSRIKVYQAAFPGKEAGFFGAVIHIIEEISNEAKRQGLKIACGIGLDLGRDEIGVGLLTLDPVSGEVFKHKKDYWLFKYCAKTPYKKHLKKFLDSHKDYTASQRRQGERIRASILRQMADLVVRAQAKAQESGLRCSRNIGVAVPGSVSRGGYIMNSTDYLPFFRKQDGFNFARSLEGFLALKGLKGMRAHLINDGIAAGIANIYMERSYGRGRKKFAFLGAGSGLGGCVGWVN